MARTKTITMQVTEETWEAIRDTANLWGDSMSKASDRLVQRGLISLDKELGSKTPAYVKLARAEEEVKIRESSEQRVSSSYQRAMNLGMFDKAKEIEAIGKELGVEVEKSSQ